jgi:hypothetical protein
MEKPLPYQAFLIRLWPTRRGGVADYRVSLQSVATGRQTEFPDLNSLADYLRCRDKGPDEETVLQEAPHDNSQGKESQV